MWQSEQETLTGIYADSILYNAIEREYERQTDDGHDVWPDKQTFCAAYKDNKDGLAEKIQRAANEKIWRTEEKHRKAMAENSALVHKLNGEIVRLKELLDIEQEWKPAEDTGTNLDQMLYAELRDSDAAEPLTDSEAKDRLSAFFGFERDRIEIIHTVSTYERNRHSKLRVAETYDRQPVYGSSDWNYIRFDCASLQWEMIDGELVPYED